MTRLTVYRHFADEAALFEACSADWLSRQRLPDPSRWAGVADPEERLRLGLADIYRFYRAGADMLYRVSRDFDGLPSSRQEFMRDRDRQLADLLAGSMPGTTAERRRRRAVVGHATSFWTWWSLCHTFGLSDRDAIDVMVAAILGGS